MYIIILSCTSIGSFLFQPDISYVFAVDTALQCVVQQKPDAPIVHNKSSSPTLSKTTTTTTRTTSIMIQRIIAAAVAVAVAVLPIGSAQTITVTISQRADGVQFAVSGKLTVLPCAAKSGTFPLDDGLKNKLYIANSPGSSIYYSLRLFSSNDVRYFYGITSGKNGVTSSSSDFSCNTFPAGANTVDLFKFSPSLNSNAAFGMDGSVSGSRQFLFVPPSYIAGTPVNSTLELIGGQTLANLGFVLSKTCFVQYQIKTGAQQRLQFVVDSSTNAFTAFHVTFYANTVIPSFSAWEQFCLNKNQALCRYDTLCPVINKVPTFFGDPDCDAPITGQQSTYIVTDSGEGCSDRPVTGAAVRWSTNDAINSPVCNNGAAQRTCTSALTPTTVLACCQLTNKAVNTWSKVDCEQVYCSLI
jgi:hypothetical protein